MIFLEDKMQYTNVYTEKINCTSDEVEFYILDFLKSLDKAGVKIKENFFYSFNSLSETGIMEIQLFQPAEKFKELIDEQISYMSYFYLDHMISTVVLGDYERISDRYSVLMEFIEKQRMVNASNIYNEIHSRGKHKYLIVKTAAIPE